MEPMYFKSTSALVSLQKVDDRIPAISKTTFYYIFFSDEFSSCVRIFEYMNWVGLYLTQKFAQLLEYKDRELIRKKYNTKTRFSY